MPKMKTDSGAAKRIKVTGTGRLRRRTDGEQYSGNGGGLQELHDNPPVVTMRDQRLSTFLSSRAVYCRAPKRLASIGSNCTKVVTA